MKRLATLAALWLATTSATWVNINPGGGGAMETAIETTPFYVDDVLTNISTHYQTRTQVTDAASLSETQNTDSPGSYALKSNRLLLVLVNMTRGDVVQTNLGISSCSWDGAALTKVFHGARLVGADSSTVEAFYLIAPHTGAKTFSATFTDTVHANVEYFFLSNVSQTAPIGSSGTASGSSTTPLVSLQTLRPGSRMYGMLTLQSTIVYTPSSGETFIDFGTVSDGIHPDCFEYVTSRDITHAAGKSLGGTLASSAAWVMGAVEVHGINAFPKPVVLAGGDVGGLWRSTDRGQSWRNLGIRNFGDGFTASSVTCLDYDARQDSAIVYLGIEGRLLRTWNSGSTFLSVALDSVNLANPAEWFTDVAVVRGHPDSVYVLRHGAYDDTSTFVSPRYPQVKLSVNRGLTWANKLTTGQFAVGTRMQEIVPQPYAGDIAFLVTGGDKYGWRTSNCAAPDFRKRVSPWNLFRTRTAGATWTSIRPSATEGVLDFAMHPDHPDTVFCTTFAGDLCGTTYTGHTWVSYDEGINWKAISTRTGNIALLPVAGAEPKLVVVDPIKDPTSTSTDSTGTWTSTSPYTTWTLLDNGIGWQRGWGFIGDGHGDFTTSAGERGIAKTMTLSQLDSTSMVWSTTQFVHRLSLADGIMRPLFTDSLAPGPPSQHAAFYKGRGVDNTIPMCLSYAGGWTYAGAWDTGIWRSQNLGDSWQQSNDPVLSGAWYGHGGNCSVILADPSGNGHVWANNGSSKGVTKMIRSVADGLITSWADVSGGVADSLISGLSLSPLSAPGNRTLYATSNGDVIKSINDGVAWTLAGAAHARKYIQSDCAAGACAGGRDTTAYYVTCVDNSGNVWRGGPSRFEKSTDGGATWTTVSGLVGWSNSTPSGSDYDFRYLGVHDIVASGSAVYVVINGNGGFPDAGVYKTLNGGTTWTPVHGGAYDDKLAIVPGTGEMWLTSRSVGSSGSQSMGAADGYLTSKDGGATWNYPALPSSNAVPVYNADTTSGIWVSRNTLPILPQTGPAWGALLGIANDTTATTATCDASHDCNHYGSQPFGRIGHTGSNSANKLANISNINSTHHLFTLAMALAATAMNNAVKRDSAVASLFQVIGTQNYDDPNCSDNPKGSLGARGLETARQLACYVIAADAINFKPGGYDPGGQATAFAAWADTMLRRLNCDSNGANATEVAITDKHCGSNGCSMSMASTAVIAKYLGYQTLLDSVWVDFRRAMGDLTAADHFTFSANADTWRYSAVNQLVINPQGSTTSNGYPADGTIPNDQGRGGTAPASSSTAPGYTSYPWDGLQGLYLAALVLDRSGYRLGGLTPWQLGNSALLRAVQYQWWLQRSFGNAWYDYPRAAWVKHLAWVIYGFKPYQYGWNWSSRNADYTQWTHQMPLPLDSTSPLPWPQFGAVLVDPSSQWVMLASPGSGFYRASLLPSGAYAPTGR